MTGWEVQDLKHQFSSELKSIKLLKIDRRKSICKWTNSAIWKNTHLSNYFLEIGGLNQEMGVYFLSKYDYISMFKL